jgi:hypothetical protein
MAVQMSKSLQITKLHQFCFNEISDTLLSDILLDSLEMLRGQVNSDFSFGNFREFATEIDQLKNSIIELQVQKNQLLIETKELEAEANKLRMHSDDAREDIEKLKLRLARVLNS